MHFFIPKKILLVGSGIGIFLASILIGSFSGKQFFSEPAREGIKETKVGVAAPSASPAALAKPSFSSRESASSGLVRVTRVIDGDTVEVEGGEKVRYIGIDTPETVDPRKAVQCFGVEAAKKNKELVEGKLVRLEKDITDKDKYGRLLRYVWLGEKMINLALVREGFAHSYSYPPDIKYQEEFIAAEKAAREGKRGLWDSCSSASGAASPAASAAPTAVSENTPAGSSANPSCIIKGNVSASGEKIYHLPSCNSYEKTRIDEGRGERWFCSEAEAMGAGWRRALNCK